MMHYGTWAVRNLGAGPATKPPWFLPFTRYRFGLGKRPSYPKHITVAQYGWVLAEWGRYATWQQRRKAGVKHPARGLWAGGMVPEWAWVIAREEVARDRLKARPVPDPTPAPAPGPANKQLVVRAQRVMFTAWRPTSGLRALGRGGKVAVSADVNCGGTPDQHREWAREVVAYCKERKIEVPCWGNQSQIGIDRMHSFASDFGFDYIIWQAETVGEMVDVGVNADGSVRPGSPIANGPVVLIGNANAWTDQQRATAIRLCAEGRLAFIQETYTCSGDPWPENYGTQGVPASSISPGVGWDRYPHQLPAYHAHTPASQWPTISPYLAEDFDDTSWAVMPW